MPKTGVLLEIEDGAVKEINSGLITAARGNGVNEVIAFAAGEDVSAAKDELARYGVSQLVRLSPAQADISADPDVCAAALERAVAEYGLESLLGLATAYGRDILARTAARLDCDLVSDVLGLDFSARTALRSHFSGKTMATVALGDAPLLVTVRPNAFSPLESPVDIEVSAFEPEVSFPGQVRIREIKSSGDRKMDLSEAPIIITGGRPIGAPENYAMLEECAEVLDGAVGASRAAVDAGYAPHSMQVGQTGKTVSPNLY
ncbi:MAG: electron transfer flavoprotein subunit alpha/FixB family protein, partial [Thermodesulfobacteriota bacterium]